MRAIEVKGSVDKNRQLHLDEPRPLAGPSPVRIIVLFPGEHEEEEEQELDGMELQGFAQLRIRVAIARGPSTSTSPPP